MFVINWVRIVCPWNRKDPWKKPKLDRTYVSKPWAVCGVDWAKRYFDMADNSGGIVKVDVLTCLRMNLKDDNPEIAPAWAPIV